MQCYPQEQANGMVQRQQWGAPRLILSRHWLGNAPYNRQQKKAHQVDPNIITDGVAPLVSTRDQLQWKTLDPSLAAKQLSLNMSRKKAKTMQLTDTPLPVQMENEDWEEIEEFTYLGNKTNAMEKDIINRLQKPNHPLFSWIMHGGCVTSEKNPR